MLKQKQNQILIGVLLLGFGIFMFFKNVRILSVNFLHFGEVSTGGILIALILLDVILLFATKHRAAKILLPILCAMLVLSVILGTRLDFTGDLLSLFLMLVPAAAGAGLLLRALLMNKEKKD